MFTRSHGFFNTFGNYVLLCDRQDVVAYPVQNKTSREPKEEDSENYR